MLCLRFLRIVLLMLLIQICSQTVKHILFLDIYREDDPGRLLDYDLRNDGEVRIIDANGTLVKIVNVREAPIALNEIFAQIKNGGAKAAFHIDQAYIEMSRFILTKIKASSYHKSDLDARIRDKVVSSSSRVGFSIKSQVGSPSTLLNASKQTNKLSICNQIVYVC